mgnify:FL=1
MLKNLIANLMKPDCCIYTLPTLHIRFVTGEEIDVVPDHWHMGDREWSIYYLENGLVLNRYPLASIVEIYEKDVAHKNVSYICDPLYLPIYIHKDCMEGDNLSFEKKGRKIVKGA